MHVNVSDGRIKEIVKRNFGYMVGNIHQYAGYSDLNYRIEAIHENEVENEATSACRIMVLKILNPDDSRYPECFGEFITGLQSQVCTDILPYYVLLNV